MIVPYRRVRKELGKENAAMGLAASQARLLSITSRMADNELRTQLINNSKMRLASQSSKVSEDYITSLNNATMMMRNYDAYGNEQYNALTFNNLTQYSTQNTQYGLKDSYGNILVTEDESDLFQKANGDIYKYLESHGLTYTTNYFEDTTFTLNNDNMVEFTYVDPETMEEKVYAKYSVEELKAMYLGGSCPVLDENGNPVLDEHGNPLVNEYTDYHDSEQSKEYSNYLDQYEKFNDAITDYLDKYQKALTNYITTNTSDSVNSVLSIDFQKTTKDGTTNDKGNNVFGGLSGSTKIKGGLQGLSKATSSDFLNYFNTLKTIANTLTKDDAGNQIQVNGKTLAEEIDSRLNNTGLIMMTVEGETFICVPQECVGVERGTGKVLKDIGLYGEDYYYMDFGNMTYITDTESNTSYNSSALRLVDYVLGQNDVSGAGVIHDKNKSGALTWICATDDESGSNVGTLNIGYLSNDNNTICHDNFDSNGKENSLVKYISGTNTILEFAYSNKYYAYEIDSDGKKNYKKNGDNKQEYVIGTNYQVYTGDSAGTELEDITNKYWIDVNNCGVNNNGYYTLSLNGDYNRFIYVYDNDLYFANIPKMDSSDTTQTLAKAASGDELNSYANMLYEYLLTNISSYSSAFDFKQAQLVLPSSFDSGFFTNLREIVYKYLNSLFYTEDAKGNCTGGIEQDEDGNLCKDGDGNYIFSDTVFTYTDKDGNPQTSTYKDLYELMFDNADEIGEMRDILKTFGDPDVYPQFAEIFAENETFHKVKSLNILDELFNEYGEPKMTWISQNQNEDGNHKAEWYINLFNAMSKGYKVIEDGLASSNEWIQFALENRSASLVEVDSAKNWVGTSHKNVGEITEVTDDVAVARAKAEYERAMTNIENKDKRLDLELKNIDTEHNSLQQEYDSVKNVMSKNIERNFKMYS